MRESIESVVENLIDWLIDTYLWSVRCGMSICHSYAKVTLHGLGQKDWLIEGTL